MEGRTITTGTQVWIIPGACSKDDTRPVRAPEGVVLTVGPANAERIDDFEWSAEEHRTLLGAVKPGEPFRQLGVNANMRDDCRKQLDHIKYQKNGWAPVSRAWPRVDEPTLRTSS